MARSRSRTQEPAHQTDDGSDVWRDRRVYDDTLPREVPPADLLANPFNWRLHGDFQRKLIKGSLTRFGWVRSVLVNITTGHVVDGHMRIEEAIKASQPVVPVEYVELTDEEEAAILASLDPIGALAGVHRENFAETAARAEQALGADEALGQFLSEQVMRMGLDQAPAGSNGATVIPGTGEAAPESEALTDQSKRGKTPEEKYVDYITGNIKQVVLLFPADAYLSVTEELDTIVADHGLDNYSEAFQVLLQFYKEHRNDEPAVEPADATL